jgi:polygalacturonase
MALTKVTDRMSNTELTNVLDFGAKGDGTTDDSAAIQAAIAAATYGVYFPQGNYILLFMGQRPQSKIT